MTKIPYQSWDPKPAAQAQVAQALEIVRDYQAQGYTLTLRQLYYQFVARDLVPNTERSYKNLGALISRARLAGLLDWEAIEDRTRNLVSPSAWEEPADYIMAEGFQIDLWEGQPVRPEVWIEKEALVGVIAPVCEELRVAYFACKGYVSQSEQWRAGIRISQRWRLHQQRTQVLHLGDHDPSGIDMTRDNNDRLDLFSALREGVEVDRIALNMDQVEEYDPPPNPTKVTDSRAAGYLDVYGDSSWELDALEPAVLSQLIRDHVQEWIEDDAWAERVELERQGRERLEEVTEELRHDHDIDYDPEED